MYTFLTKNQGENCYYISFMLIMIGKGFGLEVYNPIYIILFFSSIAMMGIKMLHTRYTKRDYIYMLVVLTIGGLVFIASKMTYLALSAFWLCGAKNIKFEKLIKCLIPIWVVTMPITIILGALGIASGGEKPYYTTNELGEEVVETISGYGYSHPNILFFCFLSCAMMYLYLRYEKLKRYDFVIVFVPAVFLYQLTQCRTGMILYVLLWLMIAYTKILTKKEDTNQKWMSLYLLVLPVSVSASFILPWFWEHMEWLNTLLTGRLRWSRAHLEVAKFTLWGQETDFSIGYIDNLYVRLYVVAGILGLAMMLLCLGSVQVQGWKNKKWKDVIYSSLFIVEGFMETIPCYIFYNPFILLVAPYFFTKEDGDKSIIEYGMSIVKKTK